MTTPARTVVGLTTQAHTRGPRASRIIDGQEWAPVLHLDPVADSIVRDLAKALHDAKVTHLLHVIACTPQGSPEHDQAMLRIRETARAREVFQIALHPDAANTLQTDLWDAWGMGDEPERCQHCDESFAMLGSVYCAGCDEALTSRSPSLLRGA